MRLFDVIALNCEGIERIGRSASQARLDSMKMIWLDRDGMRDVSFDRACLRISPVLCEVDIWISAELTHPQAWAHPPQRLP